VSNSSSVICRETVNSTVDFEGVEVEVVEVEVVEVEGVEVEPVGASDAIV
jgi:hypothetical protein